MYDYCQRYGRASFTIIIKFATPTDLFASAKLFPYYFRYAFCDLYIYMKYHLKYHLHHVIYKCRLNKYFVIFHFFANWRIKLYVVYYTSTILQGIGTEKKGLQFSKISLWFNIKSFMYTKQQSLKTFTHLKAEMFEKWPIFKLKTVD